MCKNTKTDTASLRVLHGYITGGLLGLDTRQEVAPPLSFKAVDTHTHTHTHTLADEKKYRNYITRLDNKSIDQSPISIDILVNIRPTMTVHRHMQNAIHL